MSEAPRFDLLLHLDKDFSPVGALVATDLLKLGDDDPGDRLFPNYSPSEDKLTSFVAYKDDKFKLGSSSFIEIDYVKQGIFSLAKGDSLINARYNYEAVAILTMDNGIILKVIIEPDLLTGGSRNLVTVIAESVSGTEQARYLFGDTTAEDLSGFDAPDEQTVSLINTVINEIILRTEQSKQFLLNKGQK